MSAAHADDFRNPNGWIQGIYEGEARDSTATASTPTPSGYSLVDADQTAALMDDPSSGVGLDLYMGKLRSNLFGWETMLDLSNARPGGFTGGNEIGYLGAYLSEPSGIDLTSWNAEYVNTTRSPASSAVTSYALLNDIYADVGSGLDFIALDEICNWAETAHRPPAADPDRVPTSELRTFIDSLQIHVGAEAWAYWSELGALMLGMESWVMGGDPNSLQYLSDGESVGVTLPYTCTDNPPVGHLEFAGISFLHYDTAVIYTGDDFPGATYSGRNDLIMKVFAEDIGGIMQQVLPIDLDRLFLSSTSGSSPRQGHPFRTKHINEKVELFQSKNLYTDASPVLDCDGTPHDLSIEVQCDRGSVGVCDADGPGGVFQYIADVELTTLTLDCPEHFSANEFDDWFGSYGPIVGWIHQPGLHTPPGGSAAPEDVPSAGFVFAEGNPSTGIDLKYQPYLSYLYPTGYTPFDIAKLDIAYEDSGGNVNCPPVVEATFTDGTVDVLTPDFVSVRGMGAFRNISHVFEIDGVEHIYHKTVDNVLSWHTDAMMAERYQDSCEAAFGNMPMVAQSCFPLNGYAEGDDIGTLANIELDLDAGSPSIPIGTPYISQSNQGVRLFDRLASESGVLDSAITRYRYYNKIDPAAVSGYEGFNDDRHEMTRRALARQMTSMGEAVQYSTRSSGYDSFNLTYLESLSWKTQYESDYVRMVLGLTASGTTDGLSDGLVAGHFSLPWFEQQDGGAEISEFTERKKLNSTYDLNDPVDLNDDWQVMFFYPANKKLDAMPGWYQKFTYVDVRMEGDETFTFDWESYLCKGCDDATQDMVMEVQIFESGGSIPVGQLEWELGGSYSGTGAYPAYTRDGTPPEPPVVEVMLEKPVAGLDGFTTADITFGTDGAFFKEYRVEVVMYSTAAPPNARGGYFRLLDPSNEENVDSFVRIDYESGIVNSNNPSAGFPFAVSYGDSWKQTLDMQSCFSDYLTGAFLSSTVLGEWWFSCAW
ncbi:MAG: hypothetical protein AAFV53_24965 [Myxococcota bacterium]